MELVGKRLSAWSLALIASGAFDITSGNAGSLSGSGPSGASINSGAAAVSPIVPPVRRVAPKTPSANSASSGAESGKKRGDRTPLKR
jgi:hypothetical protein